MVTDENDNPVSGATVTTAGVKQAVEDALSQAEAAAAKQEQGGFR